MNQLIPFSKQTIRMNTSNYKLILGLFLSLLLFSCDQEDVNNEPSFDYVVSYEFVETVTEEEIEARFGNDPLVVDIINFDVDAYTLTYNTMNYDNSMVEASGLVLIPKVSGKVKLTSFQHSTLAKDPDPQIDQENRAPSYLSPDNAEVYLSAFLYASNGYLISAADYIGYGSTKELFHPYEHAQTAATTSFDMLRAAKELGTFLEVEMVSKTYLMGYSQGGNSTMALHKYMEENNLTEEFPIAKSAMGAGAYHKSAVGNYIFNFEGDLGFPISLYLWVMDSYDKVYPELQNGLSYYLKEPYATEVIENGYFAISSSNPQTVFTDQFINDINNPSSAFSQALADNNIHNWRAEAPIKLYHHIDDELVPYFNSEDALAAMNAMGSTDVTLETYNFTTIDGNVHGTAGARYFQDVLLGFFR
ncbi:hypothetical protein GCM10027429_04700 [Marivirga atlantica]|uniref:Secretory lipase n=1 Tax=Marivirga atlantica TaxID=1548457 RepID=A0A937A5R5_9BACT|nr:lipase family protein [Marivirga atlantica]MBL0764080.1 hypothetical protein [Marivirga atlantica]